MLEIPESRTIAEQINETVTEHFITKAYSLPSFCTKRKSSSSHATCSSLKPSMITEAWPSPATLQENIYRVGALDIERSQLVDISPVPWMSETCIGGSRRGYMLVIVVIKMPVNRVVAVIGNTCVRPVCIRPLVGPPPGKGGAQMLRQSEGHMPFLAGCLPQSTDILARPNLHRVKMIVPGRVIKEVVMVSGLRHKKSGPQTAGFRKARWSASGHLRRPDVDQQCMRQ